MRQRAAKISDRSYTRSSGGFPSGFGAVILCYLEGRTYEEAARLLPCPVGTIKSRLSTARQRQRRRLEPVAADGLDRSGAEDQRGRRRTPGSPGGDDSSCGNPRYPRAARFPSLSRDWWKGWLARCSSTDSVRRRVPWLSWLRGDRGQRLGVAGRRWRHCTKAKAADPPQTNAATRPRSRRARTGRQPHEPCRPRH